MKQGGGEKSAYLREKTGPAERALCSTAESEVKKDATLMRPHGYKIIPLFLTAENQWENSFCLIGKTILKISTQENQRKAVQTTD